MCSRGVHIFPYAFAITFRVTCQALALAMPLHVHLAVDEISSSESIVRNTRFAGICRRILLLRVKASSSDECFSLPREAARSVQPLSL